MNSSIPTRLILVCIGFLAGCSSFWQLGESAGTRTGVSSSLVEYLYPAGEVPPDQPTATPNLALPLNVGIAFVPAAGHFQDMAISEATRNVLLGQVREAFLDREYIARIEVIPDTYLRSKSGFQSLQQVAKLYGVDVMALVSYDQVAASEDRKSAMLYWTIVGAYVIKGTENEVQTFVDTAVFDVATRTLLFRAPGVHAAQARSTAIESGAVVRDTRNASFAAAMGDMTVNLQSELTRFEERLKEEPATANVSWDKTRGGGGAAGLELVLLLTATGLAACRRRSLAGRARSRLQVQHALL